MLSEKFQKNYLIRDYVKRPHVERQMKLKGKSLIKLQKNESKSVINCRIEGETIGIEHLRSESLNAYPRDLLLYQLIM